MSRRDEVVESLDNALSSFRRDLSAALAPPPQDGHSNTGRPNAERGLGRRLSAAISGALDLPPPPSATAPPGQQSRQLPNGPSSARIPPHQSSGAAGAPPGRSSLGEVPFGSSAHHVYALPAGSIDRERAAGSSVDPSASDALPEYSRRPPPAQPAMTSAAPNVHLPPTRLHVHVSKTKKLQLEIQARGEQHVVLAQPAPGVPVHLEGRLILQLQQPESISFVRIRLKGVVRTMVNQTTSNAQAGSRTDEAVIHEDGRDLWDPSLPLPSASTSPTQDQLQGQFVFPFSLAIPGQVLYDGGVTRPLPPSFVLAGGGIGGGGGFGSSIRGSEWASCRYYVKVTLGRKGLLKVNERFIVPVIYVPRAAEPEMSPLRTLALSEGRPTPGPREDPRGWSGTMVKKQVKRGVFNGKKAQYQLSLMLPKPHTFARLTTIPLAVKITSTDPSVTGLFPLSSIAGQLIQRTHVTALGVTNIHDTKVGAPMFEVDGPNEGVSLPAAKGGQPGDQLEAVWEKRFTGSVQLTRNVGSSFATANLEVEYFLVARTTCDGVGNDAELACSVEIVSSAPGPTAVRSSPNGTNGAPPPPPDDNLGLPPSYFEAVVDGNEKS